MPNPHPPVRRPATPTELPPGGTRRRSGTPYQLRYRDADGARRYRYASTPAELWRLYHELGDGAEPVVAEDRRTTLAAYAADVIASRERTGRLRPRSATAYRDAFASMIAPRLGGRRLVSIGRRDVEDLRDELLERPELSTTSVRYAVALLGTILRQGVRDRLLRTDPTAGVELPAKVRYIAAVPSPDELGRFLRATELDELAPLWTLAATTGMRRGELLALRWRDVDLDGARLRIVGTLHRGGEVGPTKTASSRRTLALDPAAIAQLRRIGPGLADGFVFARPDGRSLPTTSIARALELGQDRAGVGRFRFHDLRHAFAAAAIDADVDIYAVSQVLGHSRIDMTADLYGHLTERASAAVVTRVGDRLLRSR